MRVGVYVVAQDNGAISLHVRGCAFGDPFGVAGLLLVTVSYPSWRQALVRLGVWLSAGASVRVATLHSRSPVFVGVVK